MKVCVLVLACVLGSVISASAQSSAACAQPALSGNLTVTTATFPFAVCAPAVEQIDGVGIELNGVKSYPVVTPEAPNASGKVAFPVSVTLSGRGRHTVRTFTYTLTSSGARQEGPLSVPFDLLYEKATPATAPTNHPR